MKFRKFYDDNFNIVSNPGRKTEKIIELADPNGSEFEIKYSDNYIDIQERINSFRDSVDINILVARFKAGDLSAIPSPINGDSKNIIDISEFPDNPQEAFEKARAMDTLLSSIPENDRNNINNADDILRYIYNNLKDDEKLNNDNKEVTESVASES